MVALKIKRFIVFLCVNVILCGIGIVILELIFGNWVNQDNINKLNIIRDQKTPLYINDLYDSPSTNIIYTRDEYGLRGQFENPSKIVVLTVGGSTTDQMYIADGLTWQDILQQGLKSVGKSIAIANAGVKGQSTFGHIRNFDWWFPDIPNLRPKYVLFYIGINDFYKDAGKELDAVTYEQTDKSIRQVIRHKSAVYHMLKTLYGVYQAEIRHKIGHKKVHFSNLIWVQEPLQIFYDELMYTRLKEYRERLEVLVKKTREFGSIPIFVTQPSRKYRYNNGRIEGVRTTSSYNGESINGVDYFYMMRKVDAVTISVGKKQNILCIDLGGEMAWEDEDFYDFVHMTPNGARKVGNFLFEELKDFF